MRPWDLFFSKIELIGQRDYWRNAYESLVAQTGRDLNDGYGRDPRKPAPNTKDQDHDHDV